jgi:hypothetical protein
LTGKSHFMLIFWLRKATLPNYINSVKWILLFVIFLQGYPLFCKSLVMVVFLCMEFGGFFYIIFSKIVYLLKKVLWMEDPVYSYCHIYTKKINCRTRHWWKTKRKKSAKWISTVQCTQEPREMTLWNHTNSVPWMLGVTSTQYHEWPRSHQLRTMNERGHTNSVPWMHAVCRLRKATFIQTNCVHSLYGVGVTAFIHGTP